jgi:hypothetical protein
MVPPRSDPSVYGRAGWEEPKEWIVMQICGEVVEHTFQVGNHVHVMLLQGVQYYH